MKKGRAMSKYPTLHVVVAGALLFGGAALPAAAQVSEAGADRSPHRSHAQAVIDAPETVDPGQAVSVSILDQKTGGQLELWSIASQEGKRERLGSIAVDGAVVKMTAPSDPGSYQLRYVNADGRLRGSQALEVAALPIVLSVPEQMRAGREAEVRWRGPARPGDMIRIIDPDTGAVLSEAPASGKPGTENVTVLPAPKQIGAYALEYRSGERAATLRRLPISVTRG